MRHAHRVPPCPHADPFSRVGRAWPGRQALPEDAHAAVRRRLRELDTLRDDRAVLDPAIVVPFLIYGVLGTWACRRTGHGGLTNAVAFAWDLGVTFPLLAA
ncbi:hypothetical protein [Methylobacterium sp. WSM2598]|uniref:hypothetical protein n=1 Tax=Methylobacterium sp. WSM2598 TaxID=398261 RepID=UPI00036F7032|nr:hypothetical protein [Methylobacterium sp. WSM2598]